MKKHLLSIVLVAVALMTSTVADAQIRFGIKAGLNLSSLSLTSKENFNWSYKHQAGFHVGAVVDFKVPLAGLGADVSVLYDQRNFKTANYDASGKFDGTYSNDKLKYISIPINIKYTFGFDEVASLYLATGPQFSFNVDNAGLTLDIPDSAGKIINSFKSKNFDFYWNVGIGFTVINHIRLGYTYNIPCTKSVDSPQGSVKNKTNQITLTYLF